MREHITKINLGKDVTKSDINIFKDLCKNLEEVTHYGSILYSAPSSSSALSNYDASTRTLTFNSDEEIYDFFNVSEEDNDNDDDYYYDDDNNTRNPNNPQFLKVKKIVLGENVKHINADMFSNFLNLEKSKLTKTTQIIHQ